ncbi:MAG: hypothetical protein H0T59_10550 [Chloroflexi bacterium]|nr:hypothetical protein [Chloroflexota bacterium]
MPVGTAAAARDSVRGGLPDAWERNYSRTGPARADTDRHGIPDGPTEASATPAATPTATPTQSSYLFGTLLSSRSRAATLYDAGVRVVHLELGWDSYEPVKGVFSSSYAAAMKQRVLDMRAAGMKVVLGAGLQYPPAWAFAYKNSRYVNQFGGTSRELNLTFNARLRARAARYLARIDADLGLENFWAVRVGAGGNVETLYPSHNADGIHNGAYWAYDPNARATSPYPGWKPGQRTYRGSAMRRADVRTWYEWYVGELAESVEWQLDAYRGLGFTGQLHLLMPGQGTRPLDHKKAIAAFLDGTGDSNRTLGRGAAWHRLLANIGDKRNLVPYVASLADGSGWDDVCEPSDRDVALTSPAIGRWSAARWVSYLADRYGLAKNGENPGRGDTNAYGLGMMKRAAAQMSACGLQGMMWAHESQLFKTDSGVTVGDYASVIASH